MRSNRSDAPKPTAHARADISHVPGLHDWERVVLVDNGVSAIAEICDSSRSVQTKRRLRKELESEAGCKT
nr:MAG TPA: hypothetical protein [Caudoviricetes sp.]